MSAPRFSEFIKAKRIALGLSQAQMAVKAFGNKDRKDYICRIENGVTIPREDTMIALLEVVGSKINYTE